MMVRTDILIFAGMIDRKFLSKALPLINSEMVRRIYVVRRDFISARKVTCFSPRNILKRYIVLSELYRIAVAIYILMKFRPHIVIGMGLIPHGVYSNILGLLFRKKKILLLMGKNDLALTYPDQKKLQRLLLRIALLADFIGTRGTRSRDWLVEKGFDHHRVFVPHNVFDFEEFAPQPGSIEKYEMIYVGLLSHYKRLDLLLEVVYKLAFENNLEDIRLAIVGDGKLKESLQRQCERLTMDQQVYFFPAGDSPYVCDLLNQSKIFVMTSEGEGLPMAMIEAMSCGLPVIVFDDADIGDVVRHGENGILVNLGDVEGFAAAVKRLLNDDDFYKGLCKGALAIRRECKNEYSLEGIMGVWKQVLTRCEG
jgi:glycosyltransferase involved in cell wall biosynthesis